jgi:hypothetical protein
MLLSAFPHGSEFVQAFGPGIEYELGTFLARACFGDRALIRYRSVAHFDAELQRLVGVDGHPTSSAPMAASSTA